MRVMNAAWALLLVGAGAGLLARASLTLASLLLPVAILLPAWLIKGDDYHRLRLEPVLIVFLFACPLVPVLYWRRSLRGHVARIGFLGRWRWAALSLIALAGFLLILAIKPVSQSIVVGLGRRTSMAIVYFFGLCAILGPLVAVGAVLYSVKKYRPDATHPPG